MNLICYDAVHNKTMKLTLIKKIPGVFELDCNPKCINMNNTARIFMPPVHIQGLSPLVRKAVQGTGARAL